MRRIDLGTPNGGISRVYDKLYPGYMTAFGAKEPIDLRKTARLNQGIVGIRAPDFITLWSMMLEPFERTGRSPEIALKILELGKRLGRDYPESIELPVEFDYTADIDREVEAFADEIERALERHVLVQFSRFHFGVFCSPVRLDVEIVSPRRRQPLVRWLKSDPQDDDSAIRVRPKLAVNLVVLVNARFGADLPNLPIEWRSPVLSAWRGDRVQPVSLFSWFVRGILIAVVGRFINKLGWHARLPFGAGYTDEDVERDLSYSLLTTASDAERGRRIGIRCIYLTDPTD